VLPAPWNQAAWEGNSERVPVPAREVFTKPVIDKTSFIRSVEIDAAKYVGKSAVIGVNVHGPHGRDDGWSIISLEVLPTLPMPRDLHAADAPNAVHLQWTAVAPAFRIFRRQPLDTDWAQIGDSTEPSFDDKTFEYGKTWQYYVQAVRRVGENWMESEPSATITFAPTDKFPPAVPAGLIVIPGTKSIELSWDPVTDSDLAGYRVYRNGVKIADEVARAAFSDPNVVAGTKYSYQVSAVDQAGNESARCAAMEVTME
jgi:fibronectin type 3 domain-containing protein